MASSPHPVVRWASRARARHQFFSVLAVVPAAIVGLSILAIVVVLAGPAADTAAWYQRQAQSLARKDYVTARLCYANLLQMQPGSAECQYNLAMSLAGLGEQSASAMLLNKLTADDVMDYAPAHLFLAEQLLRNPSPTPAELTAAEDHLQRVLKHQSRDPMAHAMLSVLYSRTGRWDLVKEHFPLAGSIVDELTLPAAQAFAARGDWPQVRVFAQRAAAFFDARVKANPNDDASRMQCAQANLMLKDFSTTLKILEAGWDQTRNPLFRQAIAEVTAMWLKNSALMDAPRRLALLETGLLWDSQNGPLLLAVLDPVTADAAAGVQPTTAPVQGAAIGALCQSVAASRRNQLEQVRPELELALSLGGPTMVATAANVSTIWAYSNDPGAGSALVLSTTLLQIRPADPVTQRAQGLILVRQEKWGAALAYLEAALPAMPADRAIHKALADAYDKLGKPDQAAEHRRLAQPPTTVPATQGTAR